MTTKKTGLITYNEQHKINNPQYQHKLLHKLQLKSHMHAPAGSLKEVRKARRCGPCQEKRKLQKQKQTPATGKLRSPFHRRAETMPLLTHQQVSNYDGHNNEKDYKHGVGALLENWVLIAVIVEEHVVEVEILKHHHPSLYYGVPRE